MSRRILAVDDEPETTHSLKRLLEAHGYDVMEVNDATKALKAARAFQPHVVILDYLMPRAHGGDVAWQLASDKALKDVKLIVCSGVDPHEFKSKLPPVEIPILDKPVDSNALLDLLRDN
jgi:CheY-like chemotaxis protein